MVATSDVVVVGTVADIEKGVMIGNPPGEIYLPHADLDLEQTLFGSGVPSPLTVQTLQFVAPEPDWRKLGNTVLAFMKLSTDTDFPGVYYPVNDQSVYLVAGTDVQATVDADPFSESLAALTLDELRSKIDHQGQGSRRGWNGEAANPIRRHLTVPTAGSSLPNRVRQGRRAEVPMP
jgi:hypothetical protein